MRVPHPKITEVVVRHQLGHDEAEGFLRGLSASDPEAARAVREIDAERARLKAANVARLEDMAGRLDMVNADALADLVGRLAADRELFTWLTGRVHLTIAHARDLEHHE